MTETKPTSQPATQLPVALADLIDRFSRNREAYRSGRYNETQLRREFIDPLFESLGWDVDNTQGYAEAYKDVIHEDSIKVPGVAGGTKAPDYCFRIGGTRKFFLEAKKPSVNIKGDPGPAYQLRRYAWSAKLPLSILTDFEEFAVYDCRIKPNEKDKPSTARVMYFTFDEWPKRWGEVASIFARESVLRGSFDKYAVSKKRKRGTAEVDDAFLEEIESWREQLARNIALRNGVTSRQLNHAVQLTIDRIIFLRICEDRGIEDYGRLQALRNGTNTYARLFELFEAADQRYNSGLFHFGDEKGRSNPDRLTPGLTIDDDILKGIVKRLYYPECPYEFSVLSADILGHVYEQFLGKVIEVTASGRRVRIDLKPEVRKAGGVYYTPTYIVDYIVKHTVGNLLEGATLKYVGSENKERVDEPRLDRTLRVLDPACGSGSFLLGAYQYLLDWHRDWYADHDPRSWAKRRKPPIYQRGENDWRLTVAERKRILLAHIFGVDIDSQAVEVTKLSLLLKVLEGETTQSMGAHLWYARERALPDLASNIKCGNSLIGPDYWQGKQSAMFDEEERYRINAFDWKSEFPEVFQSTSRDREGADAASGGGFDAVIGNPPYLSYSGRQAVEILEEERQYFELKYSSSGWPTSHGFFIEHAVRDLSTNCVGMIVPDQVGHLDGYAAVREAIDLSSTLSRVRYWGEEVFEGVVTPALTFITSTAHSGGSIIESADGKVVTITLEAGSKWIIGGHDELLKKVTEGASSVGVLVADPGVHTGNCSKKLVVPLSGHMNSVVPVLEGKQVSRYRCKEPTKGLRLDYHAGEDEYFTIRSRERYASASFVIRQTAAFPIVGPREHADYFRNSLLALYTPPPPLDVRYLVALLNSKLIRFVYTAMVQESSQKVFPQVKVRAIRELPIRLPNFRLDSDRTRHDRIVNLVSTILELCKREVSVLSMHEQRVLERDVSMIDREIDSLVYELYGLSTGEIERIESELTTPTGNENGG